MDFAELYQTDVTKHIEKKGNFNYLSWPYAVAEFRKACPEGSWRIRHFASEELMHEHPYCITESGCFVEVTVIPDIGREEIQFTQIHPVLDYKNKPVLNPDAFQVNTSIQRCLVKAIALATGIGLHIYAGEDLPEVPKITSADFEKEVDQHGTVKSIEAWWKKNATRIDRELSPAEKDKLISYCRQIKEALAETEKKFQQESDETNAF